MLHGEGIDSARWILVLGGAGGGNLAPEEAGRVSIALGDPIPDMEQAAVYVPQWILDTTSAQGQGEEVSFECIAAETLPKATRLGFRVIGDLPEDVDVRELLEGALSQLGVLSLGQMIPVPAFEGCVLMVEACEPAERVFLDGAEVALEIERELSEAFEAAVPVAVSPIPPLAVSENRVQDFFSGGMIPDEPPAPVLAQGNRLGGGGTGRSRLI